MTVTTYEEARGLDVPEAAVGTVDIAKVRALTLRYLVVSTILLGAGGLLGILLRQSQADLDRISPNLWYEVMTAHGLATFVGWAAFALMGVTWWVLAECGLDTRRLEDSHAQDAHERYAANTRRATDAGVFGAPSYVVEGEIFWGQDRLDLLERALKKLAA